MNHKDQAALIKSFRNVSAVLLRDSIIAGFLRYPNIWYKFFDENTINCGVGGDKVQNIMEGGKHSSTIITGVRCNQLWHKQPGC